MDYDDDEELLDPSLLDDLQKLKELMGQSYCSLGPGQGAGGESPDGKKKKTPAAKRSRGGPRGGQRARRTAAAADVDDEIISDEEEVDGQSDLSEQDVDEEEEEDVAEEGFGGRRSFGYTSQDDSGVDRSYGAGEIDEFEGDDNDVLQVSLGTAARWLQSLATHVSFMDTGVPNFHSELVGSQAGEFKTLIV